MVKKLKGKEERKLLFQVRKRMERETEKEEGRYKEEMYQKKRERKKGFKGLIGIFKPKKMKITRRAVARRARGTERLFGALAGTERRGRGRPKGTFKYGMPIGEYKKLQSRKKALYSEYQREQIMELRRRGVTPEQIQQLQVQRTMELGLPQPVRRIQDEPEQMVDDELRFRKFMADKSLSPSAREILTRLRRTQNLGKVANIRQQRIQKERRMISEKGNLFKAHENMIPVKIDFTGVDPNTNILMAKSVFKENPEDNILRPKRLNILQSREAGTNLKFF